MCQAALVYDALTSSGLLFFLIPEIEREPVFRLVTEGAAGVFEVPDPAGVV
jgi:hypothetical protein